ncbi:MAG: NAD(P)H-quinone oxidoreductase [Rickettsiales bacterium]|nr:NAD(P)H-quinone oxidoreductase [Rickettsiales bacterium]
MLAISFENAGGPEVLKVIDIEKPSAKKKEIIIKVVGAGVNRPDLLQREGNYPAPLGHSKILGLEVAGYVDSIGKDVKDFKIGDPVCALVNGGGYAQYCKVDERQVMHAPKNLNFYESAAIPECFFTCWANLFDKGEVKKKEKVLIHGGSSGIGTSAIQILNYLGIENFVTVGSEKKKIMCKKLGASLAINYKKKDFFEVIKLKTAKKGVDLIMDIVGGDYIQKNINLLSNEGRLINIAFQNGSTANVNFIKVMLKRLTITGSTLRIRDVRYKQKIRNAIVKNIVPGIESGIIKPVIDSIFEFRDVVKAHKRMYSGKHFGKIVLKFN